MVGTTQRLHHVLCHLRGKKGPWVKSCPDLLLGVIPSPGEAVPSSPAWGPPLLLGVQQGLSLEVPPPLIPPLPQPLPSAGDDLQQHLLGSEPRNGQLTSPAGEGCPHSMGPWGQLSPQALGAARCLSAPMTVLSPFFPFLSFFSPFLSFRATEPPDPRQLPPWGQGLLPSVLAP